MSFYVLLALFIIIDALILLAAFRKPKADGTLVVTENGGKKKVTLELTTDPDALEKKDRVIFEVEKVTQSE